MVDFQDVFHGIANLESIEISLIHQLFRVDASGHDDFRFVLCYIPFVVRRIVPGAFKKDICVPAVIDLVHRVILARTGLPQKRNGKYIFIYCNIIGHTAATVPIFKQFTDRARIHGRHDLLQGTLVCDDWQDIGIHPLHMDDVLFHGINNTFGRVLKNGDILPGFWLWI